MSPQHYCILTLSQYLFYSNLLKITRQSLLYSIFPTNHHQPKKVEQKQTTGPRSEIQAERGEVAGTLSTRFFP